MSPEVSERSWNEHAYRRLIDAETHARPVPPMMAPLRIRRLAFMSANGGVDLRVSHAKMAGLAGVVEEGPGWARQLEFERNGHHVTWELHSEFATLTWTAAPDDWVARPLGIGLEYCDELLLVFATRIDLMPTEAITPSALEGFNPLSLCYSTIFDDTAEVATDFHFDRDGFTRFEVAARRMSPLRQGVLVRRLMEIETYRTMALIGLPLAREMGGQVGEYERRLTQIVQTIGRGETLVDHQETLAGLHKLSSEVSQTVEETSFRFAATQAYGEVLAERLHRLRERAIGEFTTIDRFLNNRAQPALATCRAMEKRLLALTEKVQRSIELLDARISLSIQSQNQAVLDTISRTSASQFRLQQTVEGLSIIAISYYALGVLGHVFEALHDVLPYPKGTMLGLAAPVVVLMVLVAISRIRKAH